MANMANVAYMADMSNIFELWFAFTIRPHPSPSATPSPSKGKASDRFANLKKSASGIRYFRHLHLEFQALVRCQHFKVKTKEVCTKPSPSRGKVSPKATDEGVPLLTNLNHFYPVAERRQSCQSRWTGLVSEQPEFAARNAATSESVQQKARSKNPLA